MADDQSSNQVYQPQQSGQTFDLDAARKAGASDDDIIGHLTKTRPFDVDGARKAGAKNEDIIQHLVRMPQKGLSPSAQLGVQQQAATKPIPERDITKFKQEPTIGESLSMYDPEADPDNPFSEARKRTDPVALAISSVAGPGIALAPEIASLLGPSLAREVGRIPAHAIRGAIYYGMYRLLDSLRGKGKPGR